MTPMSTSPTSKTHSIAHFDIEYLQFLNENHQSTQSFPEFATPETLLSLYRKMHLVRTLDSKAVNLQRIGKMGTYPSSQGQEAVAVGVGYAMHNNDIYCPYYRDQGTLMQRGVKISEILTFWGGDERGSHFVNNPEDFPLCVPIATQCLHAAGIAYAIKFRQQERAVVVGCGDGATSKGDFYEAMNLAGVWQLPLVFIINNNQWAISVPLRAQTSALTLAQKAIAAGIQGLQVDGNDIIAVVSAVTAAISRARRGEGATVIEALTYRLADHTTADDANRYRSKEETKKAWSVEPIARLGYYLESQGLWTKEKETELLQQCTAEIESAVNEYLKQPPAPVTDMFDYLYAKLPDALLDQRDELVKKTTEIHGV